jgi:Beta-lactamase
MLRRPSVGERLTAAGLAPLHAVAQQHVDDQRLPGLVVLIARGGQVHVEALGQLAVGGAPVTRDSLFRIASTTKPITAAATLTLVEQGVIALDEPGRPAAARAVRAPGAAADGRAARRQRAGRARHHRPGPAHVHLRVIAAAQRMFEGGATPRAHEAIRAAAYAALG